MMGKNTERPSKIFSGFGEAAPVAPNRKKRNGSSAGKRHMARVAQLPCVLCGAHGVQVHHLREGEAAGAGQRALAHITRKREKPRPSGRGGRAQARIASRWLGGRVSCGIDDCFYIQY